MLLESQKNLIEEKEQSELGYTLWVWLEKTKWIDMDDLRNLWRNLKRKIKQAISQSDQIKSYLDKIKDSVDLIKRCFVILVSLAGLMLF